MPAERITTALSMALQLVDASTGRVVVPRHLELTFDGHMISSCARITPDGYFIFVGLEPRKYVVTVIADDYAKHTETIAVSAKPSLARALHTFQLARAKQPSPARMRVVKKKKKTTR